MGIIVYIPILNFDINSLILAGFSIILGICFFKEYKNKMDSMEEAKYLSYIAILNFIYAVYLLIWPQIYTLPPYAIGDIIILYTMMVIGEISKFIILLFTFGSLFSKYGSKDIENKRNLLTLAGRIYRDLTIVALINWIFNIPFIYAIIIVLTGINIFIVMFLLVLSLVIDYLFLLPPCLWIVYGIKNEDKSFLTIGIIYFFQYIFYYLFQTWITSSVYNFIWLILEIVVLIGAASVGIYAKEKAVYQNLTIEMKEQT